MGVNRPTFVKILSGYAGGIIWVGFFRGKCLYVVQQTVSKH